MFCCICNGTCNHIGPHSYCEFHGKAQVIRVEYPAYPLPAMPPAPGWVCPVCGGGNASWVARCPCKPIGKDTKTTEGALQHA